MGYFAPPLAPSPSYQPGKLTLRRHQQYLDTGELKRRVELSEAMAQRQRLAMQRMTSRDPFIAGVMEDMLRQREEMVRLARAHLELVQGAEPRDSAPPAQHGAGGQSGDLPA